MENILEGINLFLLIIIIIILFIILFAGYYIYTLYLHYVDIYNKDKILVKQELDIIKAALEVKIPQIQTQIAELEKELRLIIKILSRG